MTRTTSYYLTQLANELRLSVPEDEAAEMVTEIAGHLDSNGADPWDEFGPPTTLAADMVAHRGLGQGRRWKLAAITGFAVLMLLLGLELTMSGNVSYRELGPPMVFALIGGVFATSFGNRFRDHLRERPLVSIGAMIATFAVLSLIGSATVEQLEGSVDIPSGRIVGIALILLSIAAMVRFFPPLRFTDDSGLKGGVFGGVKHRRRS